LGIEADAAVQVIDVQVDVKRFMGILSAGGAGRGGIVGLAHAAWQQCSVR
jgi:ABC-type uncharacterized transport system ATPase subunit